MLFYIFSFYLLILLYLNILGEHDNNANGADKGPKPPKSTPAKKYLIHPQNLGNQGSHEYSFSLSTFTDDFIRNIKSRLFSSVFIRDL